MFTWYLCQLCRVVGWGAILWGVYGLVPHLPYPALVPGATRLDVSLLFMLFLGPVAITVAESWLVIFQTERNTAEIVDELRRLRRSIEVANRRSQTKTSPTDKAAM